ncbi:MAG: hypothetical protein ACYCU3_21725, partial [Streptosporangiaceae bacterium]
MRVAVVPGPGRGGLLCPLDDHGGRVGDPVVVNDLAAAIRDREQSAHSAPTAGHGSTAGSTTAGSTTAGGTSTRDSAIRWVWFTTAALYLALARAGVVVARCHDVSLTEALLRTRDAAARDGARGAAAGA